VRAEDTGVEPRCRGDFPAFDEFRRPAAWTVGCRAQERRSAPRVGRMADETRRPAPSTVATS